MLAVLTACGYDPNPLCEISVHVAADGEVLISGEFVGLAAMKSRLIELSDECGETLMIAMSSEPGVSDSQINTVFKEMFDSNVIGGMVISTEKVE